MISWLRRVASKPFLSCLLVLVLLTFLLHSDQRFPLIRENVLGREEGGEDGERQGDTMAKNYWKFPNSNQANETARKIKTVTPNETTSPVRLNPSMNLLIANHSVKGLANTVAEPEIFSPKPTTQHGAANTRKEPVNKVLLLSSVGRSGSSFLGQLLAAQENTAYIYEPIRGLPPASRYLDTTDELLRYFNCTVRNTVFQEGASRNIIVVHFPNVGRKKKQITPDTVVERCLAEPILIIKTIRTRIKWVLARMQRNEFDNVKVIHLVRDPRGSFISMKKLSWKLTREQMCDHIYRDLQESEAMMSLYPSRYIFVKYEDLCRDPYGQTRRLLHFIRGQGDKEPTTQSSKIQSSVSTTTEVSRDADWDLPKGVRDFLRSHMHSSLMHMRDPYTTVRNTSSMYQRWRWVITQEELKMIEPVCQNVIDVLGHRMFYNFTTVRNASIPLFTDEYLNKSHPL